MKPANPVLIFTDADTDKPYARQLSDWECTLVVAQLQALDGGKLKVTEIAPFIMRSAAISEEDARKKILAIDQMHRDNSPAAVAQRLQRAARNGVGALLDMAQAQDALIGQRINAKLPPSLVDSMKSLEDELQYATCYQCGQRTSQHARYGDEDNPDALTYHCKACNAEQCERQRCVTCDKVCTRPDTSHYCNRAKP